MKRLWQLKKTWKIWPCWSSSYKGQGQVKITQHEGLVVSVGLSNINEEEKKKLVT